MSSHSSFISDRNSLKDSAIFFDKKIFVNDTLYPLSTVVPTGWRKSHFTEKKLNISIIARANELIFFSMIKACSSFISIRTRLERTFVKYPYWLQQKKMQSIPMTENILLRKNPQLIKGFWAHILPNGRGSADHKNFQGFPLL